MNFSKNFYLIFFSFIFFFQFCVAVDHGLDGFDALLQSNLRTRSSLLDRIEATKILIELRDTVEEKVKKIDEEISNSSDQKKIEILELKKHELKQAIKNTGVGDVIARGLGGKGAKDAFKDVVFGDDVTEGIKSGVIFRASDSIGQELGKSIDNFVGKGFNSGTGLLIRFFSFFNNLIFHGGKTPFDAEEVNIWKSLIINDMRSLEKMLKDGGKNESRSRDMIARELGDGEDKVEKDQMKLIWKDFSESFAEQCIYIVNEIGLRKKYYKEKDLIVFYASQLQKRLLGVAKLTLKMNSLKDFSTLGEINSVFPSITKNMEKLFFVLEKQIKASQYSFGKKKSSSFGSSSSSSSDYGYGYGSDYPKSFE